jgi:shikimate 5-dehydrogenase
VNLRISVRPDWGSVGFTFEMRPEHIRRVLALIRVLLLDGANPEHPHYKAVSDALDTLDKAATSDRQTTG